VVTHALGISPLCADAYVLLAEEAQSIEEARDLYAKGVEAGELALGPQGFEEYAGHFWDFLETRPYMRARGLSGERRGGVGACVIVAVLVGVLWASTIAISRGRQGPFLSFFVAAMIAACLMEARLLSSLDGWDRAGPLLLFIGLLTLLNAPFDWASLGLTRALLRRGLELGGWWPYGLALVDAGLAAVIIAALGLTMVVGVQAFDALAVRGGGAAVLPLQPLFTGIATHPSVPEYWWLYALLLSTMIPSLVNLVIGGTSLIRGLPGVPSLLLRYIPERGGVLKWDPHWIATVLTAQSPRARH
jgi:hypothetical protein